MKTKSLLLMALSAILFFASCKKDSAANNQVSFIEPFGTANGNGEYTLMGQASSPIRLEKIVLTKEGSSTPFIVDDTTPKNKLEHTFSYQITGIVQDTYINIDVYNLEGGKSTNKFLIKK